MEGMRPIFCIWCGWSCSVDCLASHRFQYTCHNTQCRARLPVQRLTGEDDHSVPSPTVRPSREPLPDPEPVPNLTRTEPLPPSPNAASPRLAPPTIPASGDRDIHGSITLNVNINLNDSRTAGSRSWTSWSLPDASSPAYSPVRPMPSTFSSPGCPTPRSSSRASYHGFHPALFRQPRPPSPHPSREGSSSSDGRSHTRPASRREDAANGYRGTNLTQREADSSDASRSARGSSPLYERERRRERFREERLGRKGDKT